MTQINTKYTYPRGSRDNQTLDKRMPVLAPQYHQGEEARDDQTENRRHWAHIEQNNSTYERQDNRPRRVRFTTEETDNSREESAPPLVAFLTREASQELWYQLSDLCTFKRETRNLIKYGTQGGSDSLLGLDRFAFERIANKKRSIRLVLLAQKQQRGSEFIRNVSRKCSFWARNIAHAEGHRTFCQIWNPVDYNDEGHLFFSDYPKRKSPQNESGSSRPYEERRVRPRTASHHQDIAITRIGESI
jgi:hypothetical protein